MPSTAIERYRYDEERRMLFVRYCGGRSRRGRPYTYHDVPLSAFLALEKAESKGTFINKVIKPRYRYSEGGPI
jgi:hypothetical protein